MQIEDLLEKSLDHRNKELWETLDLDNNILLEESFENNYLVNFRDNIITIYIDSNNPKPSSFAHELLHIIVKNRSCNIGKIVNGFINQYQELDYISKPLKDHMGNCLEHVKMIDLFTELGYKRHEFLDDYDVKKMTWAETLNLKLRWANKSQFRDQTADFYIGKFFAIKACPNPKFKYAKPLKSLNKLSPQLFEILDNFWREWIETNLDQPEEIYEELASKFALQLSKWNHKGA